MSSRSEHTWSWSAARDAGGYFLAHAGHAAARLVALFSKAKDGWALFINVVVAGIALLPGFVSRNAWSLAGVPLAQAGEKIERLESVGDAISFGPGTLLWTGAVLSAAFAVMFFASVWEDVSAKNKSITAQGAMHRRSAIVIDSTMLDAALRYRMDPVRSRPSNDIIGYSFTLRGLRCSAGDRPATLVFTVEFAAPLLGQSSVRMHRLAYEATSSWLPHEEFTTIEADQLLRADLTGALEGGGANQQDLACATRSAVLVVSDYRDAACCVRIPMRPSERGELVLRS